MPERRIQRQTLIEGWNQTKLDNSTVINLGAGLTSRYAALLSACLEFGQVLLSSKELNYQRQQFMGRDIKTRERFAPRTAKIIKGINPEANIAGYHAALDSKIINDICTHYCEGLFHSGNNWKEKREILSNYVRHVDTVARIHNKKHPQTFVMSAGNEHEIRVAKYDLKKIRAELLMPQFRKEKMGDITALASASMGLAEIVRDSMDLGENPDEVITWNLQSNKRTSHIEDFDWSEFNPKDKKIAVIGMGAVGLMYLEAIHTLGFKTVYPIDFDRWELTNFSRAPHCSNENKNLKAHAAARHFNAREGATRYISKNMRFDEDSKLPKVDLIISAVDGFDNQMRVINYSQRHQIPLLLGGCTPYSSVVYGYCPGKTSSMLYQFDFLKQAYLDSIRQDHPHCTDPSVEGSQVLTTSLCAAMLAGETINTFCNHPLQGPMRYDMMSNPRLEYIPLTDIQNLQDIQDVGTTVQKFTPLGSSRVTRTFNDGIEDIRVDKKPFEKWYNEEGNMLNK